MSALKTEQFTGFGNDPGGKKRCGTLPTGKGLLDASPGSLSALATLGGVPRTKHAQVSLWCGEPTPQLGEAMFEDLAHSALAVFLFALAGFGLTWALSPLTTVWEMARLRITPRSIDDRLAGQSLIGPVIVFGTVGLVVSGVVGWSVGTLMDEFDPVDFTSSARHINVVLLSLAVFVVAAYLANAYARFGAGQPSNLGERLYELQHQERGFYAADHMDEKHWLMLRSSMTAGFTAMRRSDVFLLAGALGTAPGAEPWKLVRQETVLAWRSSHPDTRNPAAERALARRFWRQHPSHWIRIGLLCVLAAGMLLLAIDSRDAAAIAAAMAATGLALLVVPPLVLRAARSENRRRTAILLRDLLWTQRATTLIDRQLAALCTPDPASGDGTPSWSQLLAMVNRKMQVQLSTASPEEPLFDKEA